MTDDLTRNDGEAVVNSGEVSLSGESGSSVLLGQAVAPIEVAAPGAGETVNVTLTKGQSANLNFDAAAATPVIEGNNFVLTFDSNGDGSADSRIVFLNLIEESQGADAPVLVIGGIELSAALLIGQAQALVEGDTLETAAGAGAGPQGGGGSTYSDDVGQSIGLLQAQGTLGGTELGFGTPTGGDDIDPGLFTLTVDFQTEIAGTEIDGQLFSGGFEDWDHRQADCEDGHSPMEILVSFTGGELGFLTIAGIPDGAAFFVGDPVNADGSINTDNQVATPGGSITLTPAQLAEGIFLLPPENSDADIALTFTATATTTEGTPVTVVVEATAIIDAVVDQAELNLGGEKGDFGEFVTAWDHGGEGDVRVDDNRDVSGSQLVDDEAYAGDPDVSVESLANGGYVVLWENHPDGIQAQVYDANGDKRGEQIDVDGENSDGHDVDYPDVAALADGGFVAVWRSNGNESDDTIQVRMFEYGKPAGDAIPIDMSEFESFDFIGEPSITTLANGGFVVAWSMATGDFEPEDGSSDGQDLFIQRFDADGTATPIVQIETAGYDGVPDVSALPDGGYILVWDNYSDEQSSSDFDNIQVQRYDADGNLVFDTEFTAPEDGYNYSPEVTGLNNGGFVVVYDAEGSSEVDPANVSVRVFDNNNVEVNSFELDMPASNYFENPHVSSLASGGFVVTWVVSVRYVNSDEGDDSQLQSGIYTQRFDADGNAVDALPVLLSADSDSDDPHVDGLDCDDNSAVKVFGEDQEQRGETDYTDYNIEFDAKIGGDRDGSEELTVVKIGLVDQLLGEVEPEGNDLTQPDPRTFTLVSAPDSSDDAVPAQDDAYLVIGGTPVTGNVDTGDGEDGEFTPSTVEVWAIWAELDAGGNVVLDENGNPVLHSGHVNAVATIAGGELVLDFDTDENAGIRVWEIYLDGTRPTEITLTQTDYSTLNEDGLPVVTVTQINTIIDSDVVIDGKTGEPAASEGTKLEIRLPEHADDDFDVNYSVTTRDNATDGELLDGDDGRPQ